MFKNTVSHHNQDLQHCQIGCKNDNNLSHVTGKLLKIAAGQQNYLHTVEIPVRLTYL